ncbi:MAG: hypothetical protein DI568_15305 [Sphingomonas sp.]|nr:MAG: hypothetical protein DI568_15305 [Sphingomonas sp.]
MLLLFVIAPALYFASGPYKETFPRQFNSERWISRNGMEDNERCAMLVDLKLRFRLKGRTRAQIIALLGNPEDDRREQGTSYWLLCPSFLDVWVLGIRWESGRAAEVFVHDT